MILDTMQAPPESTALARYEAPTDKTAYRFFAGDDLQLAVLEYMAHEAINEPGIVRVELHTSQLSFDPTRLIGEPAHLQFACGTREDRSHRYFHGFVQQVSLARRADCGTYFTAWLVPRMAKLHWRFESRIHVTDPSQQLDVRRVLENILKEAGMSGEDYDLRGIAGDHPIYSFLVQYEETVLAFTNRLCESEGISYFIDHQQDKDVVTFFDSVWAAQSTGPFPSVIYRPGSGALDDGLESITSMELTRAMDYENVELRGYDFRHSRRPLVKDSLSQPSEHYRELYRYPAVFQEGTNPTAELGRQAEIRRDALESLSKISAEGGGDYRSMQVGKRFLVKDVDGGTEPWVCIELTRFGQGEDTEESAGPGRSQEDSFSMQFRAVPAEQPYRPPMRTPRPIVRGTHSATVVGSNGDVTGENNEEIHTDEYGRIRIHLHFDREWKWAGNRDKAARERDTSFWVRVRQDWAGRKYGTFFLPRVGQEVLVDFLEGDPNCPVVIGSMFNDQQKVPYLLPQHKTRSTIKTNSTPGGEGFNEIRFEDKKGSEQIFMHAQSRYDLRVRGTAKTSIGGDSHFTVGGESPTGERHGDHHVRVFGNSHVKTLGDEYHIVEGTCEETFVDHAIQEYHGNHAHLVESGEYFLSAQTIVLQADQSISLKVGCNHITIDKTGINIFGLPKVLINTGGAPGIPRPDHLEEAEEPKDASPADSDESGQCSLWKNPQES